MYRPGCAAGFLLAGLLVCAAGAAPAQTMALPMVIHPDSPIAGSGPGATSRAFSQLERDGHYYFSVLVNGTPVRMVFDTGASVILLRAEEAVRLGIDPASLNYSVTTATANGRSQAAPITLAAVTVGDITRRNVPALVARPGSLGVNLLGQSFVARLAGYRQDGGRLVLLD